MKFINLVPDFEKFLRIGGRKAFMRHYCEPNKKILLPLIKDFELWEINWKKIIEKMTYDEYKNVFSNNKKYDKKAKKIIKRCEKFIGFKLKGEFVLLCALKEIDGYSRHHRGTNTIYLGLDYPKIFSYFNLLVAHEISHTARDSMIDICKGKKCMTHDSMIKNLPYIEHLIGEGIATAFSQSIFPGKKEKDYLFFDASEYRWCKKNEKLIEKEVKKLIGTRGTHYKFYEKGVVGNSPSRIDYYYGYMLIKQLLEKHDIRELIKIPAKGILGMKI